MCDPIATFRFFQDLSAFEAEASTFLRNVGTRLECEAASVTEGRTPHTAAPLTITTQGGCYFRH